CGVTVGTFVAYVLLTVMVNVSSGPRGTIILTDSSAVVGNIAGDDIINTIHIWADDPVGVYDNPDGTAITPPYPVDRDYNFDNIKIGRASIRVIMLFVNAGE